MFTLLGFMIIGALHFDGEVTSFLILITALIIISVLGWLDDRKNLSRRVRFGMQLFSALLILIFAGSITHFSFPTIGTMTLGLFGFAVGIVWLTGVTNIFNFMDGIDGLSSVQAIGAGIGWFLIFYLYQEPFLASLALIMIAGVAAFLFFNWPPAKIFMGDSGSLFLGFVLSALPIFAASYSDVVSITSAIWVAALLLWPFLFDGAFTIIRRLFKGENIFEAHRSHLYQRLNIIGWNHKKITLLYSLFILLSIVTALVFSLADEFIQLITLILLIAGSLGFARFVHLLELASGK